jgi:hypothetical protein
MSLFDFWRKPPLINDEVFGKLRYISGSKPQDGYFEGKGFFAPVGREIEYVIDSDETGPTKWQKQFYYRTQQNFTLYISLLQPLITVEFRNWKDDFVIQDFDKEFTLEFLSIPREGKQPAEWEIGFTTVHDLNHNVTILFLGEEPKHVTIDG